MNNNIPPHTKYLKCIDCYNYKKNIFCKCIRFSGNDNNPDMFNKPFNTVAINIKSYFENKDIYDFKGF